MPGGLAWPPKKEDLERLYLVDRLSAAKIAIVYGLKYKHDKVAESTVLYQLKRNGIKRRDAAEHLRKVTDAMVNEWVGRYQDGESLKQIAAGDFDPVTVWNHLKARGLVLRDKVQAQILAVTKYERTPFRGDIVERAYLMGFAKGDCQVTTHGRAIRVRTSTTHPAMAELFTNLFGCYGHVQRYPRESKLVGYEWSLEVDLDESFKFLLSSVEDALEDFGHSPITLFGFLAGFFDAEGTIYFHKKGVGGGFELSIANTNVEILVRIQSLTALVGLDSRLETYRQDSRRLGYEKEGTISRLRIWRSNDVTSLLKLMHLRHGEKISKADIALSYQGTRDPEIRACARQRWTNTVNAIRRARDQFVEDARLNLSRSNTEVDRRNGSTAR
jgi:hypothetical protein